MVLDGHRMNEGNDGKTGHYGRHCACQTKQIHEAARVSRAAAESRGLCCETDTGLLAGGAAAHRRCAGEHADLETLSCSFFGRPEAASFRFPVGNRGRLTSILSLLAMVRLQRVALI